MESWVKCSALVNGVCINGFPNVPHCARTENSGGIYSRLPCMVEAWSARLFPETGAPSANDVARARARAGI